MRWKLKLSRLREIGWLHWDPIGLDPEKKGMWQNSTFADEYDAYLIRIFSMVRRNASAASMIEYLVTMESSHMGLDITSTTRSRAEATVEAIQTDDQLWSGKMT